MPDGPYAALSPWEEHRFWLEILQDHAYFVRDHLSPSEKPWVAAANQYIDAFQAVLNHLARIPPDAPAQSQAMMILAAEAWRVSDSYYRFEGQIQQLRSRNQLNINLTPTYFNGTLLENGEYLRLLSYFVRGMIPPPLPLLSLMELWLEDQVGHALLLRNVLDPIELPTLQRAEEFIRTFQVLQAQTHQFQGFVQHGLTDSPRERRLAGDVGRAVIGMNRFVEEVVARFKGQEVLSRTTLRFLEHHFPESCYFLKKLSVYAPELAEAAGGCSLQKPSFQ